MMSKSLVALVLLSACVKHFDVDTVYRDKRVEGTYKVLQDQYGGCVVTFHAKTIRWHPSLQYPMDMEVYSALDDEWCGE